MLAISNSSKTKIALWIHRALAPILIVVFLAGTIFSQVVFAQRPLSIGRQHFEAADLIEVTDEEFVFEIGGSEEIVRCSHGKLTRYDFARPVSNRASVSLIDGTVFTGRLQSIGQSELILRTRYFGAVTFPMVFVSNIIFDRNVSPENLVRWQKRQASLESPEEQLWLSLDQSVVGRFMLASRSDGASLEMRFREKNAEQARLVDLNSAFGASFNRPKLALAPRMSIYFKDGTVVNVRQLDSKSAGPGPTDLTLHLNLPLKLRAEQFALNQIQSIESFEGEEFLFQQPLALSRFRSELIGEIPHGIEIDVFGSPIGFGGVVLSRVIAQHANSTLVLNIDPESDYFAASLRSMNIDSPRDRHQVRFSAKCRVLAVENGQLRELVEIRADEATGGCHIVGDLRGATSIVLAIESTDGEISGDQIGWIDARVGQLNE